MTKILSIAFVTFLISACSDSTPIQSFESLGNEHFTVEKWRDASQEVRGALIHSFLTQYELAALDRKELTRLLGEPTAYYDYDDVPAYFIGSQTVSSPYGKGYLVAFPFDRVTGKIKGIIVVPDID